MPRIEISGIPIPYVDQVEKLGVVIDSKLTWKPQVEKVVERINRAVYSLNFFRQFTTFELRKRIVLCLTLITVRSCTLIFLEILRRDYNKHRMSVSDT